MSAPVAAPRRVWPCIDDAARDLGCAHAALLRHLERQGRGWVLKPLDEAMYQRWHRRVWARKWTLWPLGEAAYQRWHRRVWARQKEALCPD